MKKEQKFFEKHLDNDLGSLNSYLLAKQEDLKNGKVRGVSAREIINAPKSYFLDYNPQRIDTFFNIFHFHNKEIYNLHLALRELAKEACDYYEINFDDQQFMLHGWFNVESNNGVPKPVNLEDENFYHDHSNGVGAPLFHGYYCVNAEPGSTYYNIDNKTPFENVNINNRAIVSETGHPHGIGSWEFLEPRITIAYDITPLKNVSQAGYIQDLWIPL